MSVLGTALRYLFKPPIVSAAEIAVTAVMAAREKTDSAAADTYAEETHQHLHCGSDGWTGDSCVLHQPNVAGSEFIAHHVREHWDELVNVHDMVTSAENAVPFDISVPINITDDTDPVPDPCQPIGCDNGYHLPGCPYIAVDAETPVSDDQPLTSPPGSADTAADENEPPTPQ